MAKRSNLSAALKSAAAPQPNKNNVRKPKPETAVVPGRTTVRPPARVGKKAIAGFFDEEVSLQLKQLGLKKRGASVQDLLSEALNLLFEKYGFPPIA